MAHDVRGHGGDVRGDQARIEPIILGEGAAGAGELPKPIRIDAAHREAGGEQGPDDAAARSRRSARARSPRLFAHSPARVAKRASALRSAATRARLHKPVRVAVTGPGDAE